MKLEKHSYHPKIYYNNPISNQSYGLYCTQYSSPYLAEPQGPYYGHGHNVIRQNGTGISADYNSNPFLGSGSYGGHNCVHGNSGYEISANYGCNIAAENNWWYRTSSPYYVAADFYQYQSTINYIPSYSSDPNGCSMAKVTSAENNITGNEESIFDEELLQVLQLEMEGKSEEAASQYKEIFMREKDKKKGKYALVKLEQYFWNNKKNTDFDDLVNKIRSDISEKNELFAMFLEMENHWLISEGKYDKAIENLNTILNNFKNNDDIYKNTLFSLGFINYTYLGNTSKAKEYFAEIETKYQDDPLVIDFKSLLGETDGVPNTPKFSNEDEENVKNSENQLPEEYDLLGNYPNPFNPTTAIRYALPKESDVVLTIFDMLGKEIKSFIINSQSAGYQNIIWSGTNNNNEQVSSGIYIYRFKARLLEDGKVFEKSAKLLMMK